MRTNANDEFAELGEVPKNYAAYQLPPISVGNHQYYGWKLVKQKVEDYTDEDGSPQQRQLDDDTAAVTYDTRTATIMANANLLKMAASQQLINARLLKEIAILKEAK